MKPKKKAPPSSRLRRVKRKSGYYSTWEMTKEQEDMLFVCCLPLVRDAYKNKYMSKDLLNEVLAISIKRELYECSSIIKKEIEKFI